MRRLLSTRRRRMMVTAVAAKSRLEIASESPPTRPSTSFGVRRTFAAPPASFRTSAT